MDTSVESSLTRERVFASRWLSMDFSLWLHYSGFQAVLAEPLPSNGHIRHNTVHKETVCSATAANNRPLVKENIAAYSYFCHNKQEMLLYQSSVPPGKWHDRFLPNPFKFTIHLSFSWLFNDTVSMEIGPPLWSSGQSSWLQIQRSQVRFLTLPDFMTSSGSGTGSTQHRENN
jgi:hypothetical protein